MLYMIAAAGILIVCFLMYASHDPDDPEEKRR